MGAEVVTLSSAANLSFCRELGANEALDYATTNLSTLRPVDVVFDVYGNLSPAKVRGALAPRATYISTIPSLGRAVRDVVTRLLSRPDRLIVVRPRRSDLDQLAAWLVQGQLRAVIDSKFPLERFAEAFAVLESRRARGKVVIDVA